MSPAQIIRTVAIALITGGGALGLVPSGMCGAGWWRPSPDADLHGWYALGGSPGTEITMCETAMAPVGSWATALVVIGVTLVVVMWFNAHYRLKGEPVE